MEEILRELGLSANETKVYLKLSEIGSSSAYKVAKEAGIFKANAYDALKNLEEKGLVSKMVVDNKVSYEAADPSIMLDFLDSKKEKLNSILPRIRLLQQTIKQDSYVKIYKGSEALKNIFYHMLEFNEPILAYGVPKDAYKYIKFWIDNFHKERIKRGIKMLHIYNFDASERINQLKGISLTPIRCLPELYDSQVATNICGDEVLLVTFGPKMKIIMIKDHDMASAYKKYFNILWKQAKKVN